MSDLKDLFLLDPEVTYLNHGSFGATPRPVFETYQYWQRELEREPVDFFVRRVGFEEELQDGPLREARKRLAAYVHAPPDTISFTINTTVGLNTIARSFESLLKNGDEVLTTNHEYGTIDQTWQNVCARSEAKIVYHSIEMPVTTHDDFIESFWESVTERTRVIVISHITSRTALILPVAEICRRAREAGITTVIDGAHGVGQVPLDMGEMNPDFYVSNCHKWLCAPKGTAFVYARPDQQDKLQPLVTSWAEVGGVSYPFLFDMWGTRDLAGFLSIPAAIDFQAEHDWDAVRARCRTLAAETRARVNALTGMPALTPEDGGWLGQMAAMRLPAAIHLPAAKNLPDGIDGPGLHSRLRHDYQIEIPVSEWQDGALMRVSVQGYNTQADCDRLVDALAELLT